ncbi:MAG: hypothetical protein IJK54_09730 [Clostridia bacterium]|nr:hypothetical protein [Clostridia bacterium]
MAREPKQYEDDDGRTIVEMDVEGMPWHTARMKREKREQARAELQEKIARGEALTTRQTIRYTFYAVLAGLAVVGFVAGGVCLLILILWLCWK